MLTIDGSMGEGGGQVLRTSLSLALVTEKPFRIEKIRANRKRPGLRRQHLTAVRAATRVGGAGVEGDELGSVALRFAPGTVRPGDYHFDVGTAGSATLVLQTVLPALLTAAAPSRLVLEGGTHNPMSPPFDFLARSFLPFVASMGPRFETRLERHGFYPAGGGRFVVDVTPVAELRRRDLLERGEVRRRRARVLLSRLPEHIGNREAKRLRNRLGLRPDEVAIETIDDSPGPGNAVIVEIECDHVTEVITAFGQRGVRAEAVADAAAREARAYLESDAPAGEHLADQILLPVALAGGGAFRTTTWSRHAATNLEVMQIFLELAACVEREVAGVTRVEIDAR